MRHPKWATWPMRGGPWPVHHRKQMSARQKPSASLGAGVTPEPTRAPAVIVFGGELVVGQALELLLRGAEYNARFLAKPPLEQPELLDGIQLLIFAPRLAAGRREAILAAVRSIAISIPVLELVDDPEAARDSSNRLVPWPCRIQDLKQHIEAALRTESGANRAAMNPHTR